ncbi:hypothetical protein STVIR_8360 [Streptomyces viridochromogenes Tue57]|uniref:Uncharacterized protein n=1 Tax=Streptomyces viridochromogenes Tue57 TaxID=1160705 RepID=L8P3G2_STRVR|nr:hypothetical protein STVIR_8360 [Streptomyces viridochromogenes Tue57]
MRVTAHRAPPCAVSCLGSCRGPRDLCATSCTIGGA